MDAQHAYKLHTGKRVMLEPSEEVAPLRVFKGHTLEVTGLAVNNDATNPLIISGSEDRYVYAWSADSLSAVHGLRHEAAVRAVACSPPGATHNYCLAGCADGSIYLWDLTDGRQLDRVRNAHGERVGSLAFSPDGRWFGSGGGDALIKLWEIRDGTIHLLYPFTAEHGVDQPHNGSITALDFLPQAKLVSASRDRTLRVWDLHSKGARLAYEPLANRSGDVPHLGVSKDGRWMLFEQSRALQLRAVETGRTMNTLENAAGSIPFSTLALFSPDASLLLTAGGAEARLQLWKAPTENSRGFELRQLVTDERFPVTCAAFSPLAGAAQEANFAVSGTKNGYVYYWPLPTQAEIDGHRVVDVPITMVAQAVDTSSRKVPIRLELRNQFGPQYPQGRLKPGRPVTIVIEP